MKGTVRGSLLRMVIAFFAGALSMLLFLAPGTIPWEELFGGEKTSEAADFQVGADRIENLQDLTLYYAKKAEKYIRSGEEE